MFKYFVTSDCQSKKFIDYYSFNKNKAHTVLSGEDETSLRGLPVNTNWLDEASKTYNISNDLNDYVIVCVKIFCSDLPNRNGVAFPKKELMRFNPEAGCLAYKTWVGKPTFQEHNNNILENAKGVIFDSTLRPSKGLCGDLVHVDLLAGYDRTKDPDLVRNILSGKANCYSMGAYSDDFTCSICGKPLSAGGCKHASLDNPSFELIDGKLPYLNVVNPVGFELSSVETPAFVMAVNTDFVSKPLGAR